MQSKFSDMTLIVHDNNDLSWQVKHKLGNYFTLKKGRDIVFILY